MSLVAARSPHRAWIEVDHAALAHNLASLRRVAGDECSVIAVEGRPVTLATWASVRTSVWVGAHTSARSACTCAVQFMGSIAACASSGSS